MQCVYRYSSGLVLTVCCVSYGWVMVLTPITINWFVIYGKALTCMVYTMSLVYAHLYDKAVLHT